VPDSQTALLVMDIQDGIVDRLGSLLRGVVADPDRRLGSVDLLRAGEARILAGWAGSTVDPVALVKRTRWWPCHTNPSPVRSMSYRA